MVVFNRNFFFFELIFLWVWLYFLFDWLLKRDLFRNCWLAYLILDVTAFLSTIPFFLKLPLIFLFKLLFFLYNLLFFLESEQTFIKFLLNPLKSEKLRHFIQQISLNSSFQNSIKHNLDSFKGNLLTNPYF